MKKLVAKKVGFIVRDLTKHKATKYEAVQKVKKEVGIMEGCLPLPQGRCWLGLGK